MWLKYPLFDLILLLPFWPWAVFSIGFELSYWFWGATYLVLVSSCIAISDLRMHVCGKSYSFQIHLDQV